MCGIAGYIGKKNINRTTIIKTLNLMQKRGPDSNGRFFENTKKFNRIFLHTRLSIIDLNKHSNQPFEDNNFLVIFNGEIYNYIEIRENLIKKGYKFKTNSDTEVLLKAYIEYKDECVNKFIGMWAFAIFNKSNKNIFLSRDIFGEKPLYYYYKNNEFIFGSEIKFINSLIDKGLKKNFNKIIEFLNFGYKSVNQNNNSFYKDIKSVEPGCSILIDKDLNLKKKKFFKINNLNLNPLKKDYKEIVIDVQKLILKSLELRLRADVPLAFCLSGGVDSSFLASLAVKKLNKKINTFSIIDKDERYDESKNIKKVVNDLGCENHQIELSKDQNFFHTLKKLVIQNDGPMSTISYYVHSFLVNEISKSGYKVSISGTGADELFTGYYDHYLLYFASIKNNLLRKREINQWNDHCLPLIINDKLKDPFLYIKNPNNTDSVFGIDKDLKILIKKTIKNKNKQKVFFKKDLLKNRLLNELFYQVVPSILKHDDLNSMNFSVENRSPYLDKELFKYSLMIPTNYLIKDGFQKKVLRDCSKNILLDEVRNDRKKVGFNASIFSLVKLKEIKDFLCSGDRELSQLVDFGKLFIFLEKGKIESKDELNKFLFNLVNLKIFLDKK